MRKQRWTCMEVALHYWDTFLKRKHRIPNDAFGVVGLRAMETPVSRSPLPSFSSLSPLLLVGVYRTAIEHLSGIYPRENLPKQVSKHNGEYLGELYSSLRSRSCCSAFPYRRWSRICCQSALLIVTWSWFCCESAPHASIWSRLLHIEADQRLLIVLKAQKHSHMENINTSPWMCVSSLLFCVGTISRCEQSKQNAKPEAHKNHSSAHQPSA